MTSSWYIIVTVFLFFLGAALGCKDQKTPADVGKKNEAVVNTQQGMSGPQDINAMMDPNADLLAAQYQVNVYAGLRVCQGEVAVKVKASFDKDGQLFQIPEGKVRCLAGLLGEFDLAQTFAGLAKSKGGSNQTAIEVQNNIIRLKGWDTQVYNPPYRPFLPSFLAATPEQLKALLLEEKVSVRDTVTNKMASGVVGIRTISFDKPYRAELMQRNFDKNLRFEVVNKGFDGIEKVGGILFDRLEMVVSLSPFAIPYLVMESRVKDLQAAAPGMGGGLLAGGPPSNDPLSNVIGGLIGLTTIRIELQLLAMKGL